MSPHASDPRTLALHAVRLLGLASTQGASARFGLHRDDVEEGLYDVEAYGWVTRSRFAGSQGWSLTDAGRVENERLLAAELDRHGLRPVIAEVHRGFLPVNARFQDAVTRWQLRPLPGDPMAANDHTDFRWDDRALASLQSVGRRLAAVESELATVLARFEGYTLRYTAALDRATAGGNRWVDGVGIDSCHVVWMQLHEDLLATLGLHRGAEQ